MNFHKIILFILDKKLVRQYFTLFDKTISLPSDLNKRKYNRL